MNLKRQKICLPAGEVMHREGDSVLIACRRGRLWLTQTGVARDVLLAPGEAFRSQGDGLIVIEALEPSCLEQQITPAAEFLSFSS